MQVKLLVSAKVGGEWKKPGAVVELLDDEARRLFRLEAAQRPSVIEVGSSSDTYTREDVDDMIEKLIEVEGVDNKLVGDLIDAGFTDVELLMNAEVNDLCQIKGIGKRTAERIIDSAAELAKLSDE